MALNYGFFNSVNGDRRYDARWFAKYFATFIGNGIFPNPSTGLQVVEGENMTVIVKPGKAWINGYYADNDTDYAITLDNADGLLKRIDCIVLRWNQIDRVIEFAVKKGAFASIPVAPALQRDGDYYELVLADVLISKGTTQITQANITDTRLNTELCGIVHGLVNQVDTTTLFNQYQSWIEQQKVAYETELATWTAEQIAEFEQWQALNENQFATWKNDFETAAANWFAQEQQDFETWFATLQDLLDGNLAATLTAKVQALETGKANSEDLTQLQTQVTQHLDDDARHVTQAFKDTISADISAAYNLANEVQIELSAFKSALTEGFTANQFSDGLTTLDAFNVTSGYYNQSLSRLEV